MPAKVSLHQTQIREAKDAIQLVQDSLPPGAQAQFHLNDAQHALRRAIQSLKAEGR